MPATPPLHGRTGFVGLPSHGGRSGRAKKRGGKRK